MDFDLHLSRLSPDVDERFQCLADPQAFGGREVKLLPPDMVVGSEGIALGRGDVVAAQHTVEPVLEPGLLLDRWSAMSEGGTGAPAISTRLIDGNRTLCS